MSDLLTRCITHIQSIIDQLYLDLDACQDDEHTAELRAAIQRLEDTLHQLNE